jgi:hypothetical protein
MKKLSIFLITPLTLLGMNSGYADSQRVTNPENEHFYQRIDASMTWRDAKRFCDDQGGYLATITSQTENDFVYFQVVDGQTVWLGGTDRDAEEQWEWVTGETWEYTNWSSSIPSQNLAANPNNDGKGQDYLTFWDAAPTKWDDAGFPHLDVQLPFICEWGDVTVTTYTQADMDTAKAQEYESGRQACIADPLSCGISVSGAAATFSPTENLLRIPSIEVPGPFGQTLLYSGDMLLTPSETPFGFHFEIQTLEQTQ